MIRKILNIRIINCIPLALGLAVYRAWKNAIAVYPLDGTILMIILSGLAVIVYLIVIAMYVWFLMMVKTGGRKKWKQLK